MAEPECPNTCMCVLGWVEVTENYMAVPRLHATARAEVLLAAHLDDKSGPEGNPS